MTEKKRWDEQDVAAIKGLMERHKGEKGAVSWSRARQLEPQIYDGLIAKFGDVKALHRKAFLINHPGMHRARYEAMKKQAAEKKAALSVAVQQARHPATQETQVNYCPNCGFHMAAVSSALSVIRNIGGRS